MARDAIIKVNDANTTTGWRNLANPSGPGCLKGIGAVQVEQGRHNVKIEIDGRHVTTDKIAASGTGTGNDGMCLDLPFYDNLEVDIQNIDNKTTDTMFWASYILGTDE